jgi:hypothetical protein
MSKPFEYEVAFEQEMSAERLREMLNIIENAAKYAVPGQTLRLKVGTNLNFVIKDLVKNPISKALSYEKESSLSNNIVP